MRPELPDFDEPAAEITLENMDKATGHLQANRLRPSPPDNIKRSAAIGKGGIYRWTLNRYWPVSPRNDKGKVVWVMLNPSTADDRQDDPTIRRCIAFSQRWGYSALQVVNLFALRATAPAALKSATIDPVGAGNNSVIHHAMSDARLVIAAWGVHGTFRGRAKEFTDWCAREGHQLHCLGLTKEGHPRHPLYVKGDALPIEYMPEYGESANET